MKLKTISLILLIIVVSAAFLVFVRNVMGRKYFSTETPNPTLASPGALTKDILPLSLHVLPKIEEIETLPLYNKDAVIALSEDKDTKFLQVLSESGIFTRWDLTYHKILITQPLFFSSIIGHNNAIDLPAYKVNNHVGFNNNGSLLFAPFNIKSEEDLISEKLISYIVWDTDSMEELIQYKDIDQNYILHPTAEVVISASNRNVSITFGFTGDSGGGGSMIERSENEPVITRISLDPQGDYLAVADNGGQVQIGNVARLKSLHLEDDMFNLFYPNAIYRLPDLPRKNTLTVDLKFDPSHTWLGWLTDESLVVWNLQNYVHPLQLKVELKGSNVMSFDRTGTILAIGTNNGIQFFDLAARKQISEYAVGEVTALYFSRDNRLLIWGDSQGIVHLWGVK
ncbi:MAG: hypothetical protein HFACDABA_00730 [Anaerolineales bacterium]|nr:hypothetical protein [Anaerolineales bacterium]